MSKIKSFVFLLCGILGLVFTLASCEKEYPFEEIPIDNNNGWAILKQGESVDFTLKEFDNGPYSVKMELRDSKLNVQGEFNGSLERVGYLGNIPLNEVKISPDIKWQSANEEILFELGQSYILEFHSDGTNPEYSYFTIRIVGLEKGTDWIAKGPKGQKYSTVKIEFGPDLNLLPVLDDNAKTVYPARGGFFNLLFKYPTPITTSDIPDWLDLRVLDHGSGLLLYFDTNLSPDPRSYTLQLSPDVSIEIVQEGCPSPKFDGGDGSRSNPYRISTPEHLDSIRFVPDAYYIQTQDIDLKDFISETGGSWFPIYNFRGEYDGQMHWIKNLTINAKTLAHGFNYWPYDVALFKKVKWAMFKNIRLHVGDDGITAAYVGSAASLCLCDEGTFIRRCSVDGSFVRAISGPNSYIASNCYGIASEGEVSECYSNIEVIGSEYITGLSSNTAENCYVVKGIFANQDGTSIIDYNFRPAMLGLEANNCYALGNYIFNIDGEEKGCLAADATSCYSLKTNTEAELKRKSTYVGWDFENVWTIDEGVSYPRLRCFEK